MTMTIATFQHVEPLREEWLDVIGHLNEASYSVAFGIANWPFCDELGIGVAYVKETGRALYTVESHLRLLKEVRAPAELHIEGTVLEYDAKRLRSAMTMTVDGIERATIENLGVHVDTRSGRTMAFPDAVIARLERFRAPSLPDWAGRGISLAKR